MDLLDFDAARLRTELGRLTPRLRVAFAAACAQRLHGPYMPHEQQLGPGPPGEFSGLLEELWDKCERDEWEPEWAERTVRHLEESIPPDDDVVWSQPGQAEVRNFSVATLYAMESYRRRDIESAVAAANNAYEVPLCAMADWDHLRVRLAEAEEEVAAHPLVQAELAAQRRDLEELLQGPDTPELVRRLRERAQQESVPSDTP